MKKLLLLPLFLLGCSNIFSYQDVKVYDLSFVMKDPYTLSKAGEKTTIRYKDVVISVIQLEKDIQSASAYANAIQSRLKDKDITVSHMEEKTNKQSVKFTFFSSNTDEINSYYAIIKQPEKAGYIVACNKKEYDKDNLCDLIIDSLKVN